MPVRMEKDPQRRGAQQHQNGHNAKDHVFTIHSRPVSPTASEAAIWSHNMTSTAAREPTTIAIVFTTPTACAASSVAWAKPGRVKTNGTQITTTRNVRHELTAHIRNLACTSA